MVENDKKVEGVLENDVPVVVVVQNDEQVEGDYEGRGKKAYEATAYAISNRDIVHLLGDDSVEGLLHSNYELHLH